MSIFKIIKNNPELYSITLDTQSSRSDNKKVSNSIIQSYQISQNLTQNNHNIESKPKTYTRKDINIFYSKIKLIRRKYNIKKSRKNNIDSLVKKAKSKFLKAVYECLKFCLHSYINRLPQKFIINTKIEYNKKFLCKTLEEIYSEFKLLPTYETLLEKNMVQKGKERILCILMKSKVKDIYKEYLKSDFYTFEKKEIEAKNGIGVAKLYDFVASNICEYFLFNKGNDKRIGLINKHNMNLQINKNNESDNANYKGSQKIINNNIFVKFNILKLDSKAVEKEVKEKTLSK